MKHKANPAAIVAKNSLLIAALVLLGHGASAARVKKPARAPAVVEATETLAGEDGPMSAKLVAGNAATTVDAAPAAFAGESAQAAAAVSGAAANAGAANGAGSAVGSAMGSAATAMPGTMGAPAADAGPAAPTAAEVAKLPENQIPVLTGSREAKKSSGDGYTRLMVTLGVLVVGLGAILFALKKYAAKRGTKQKSTKIQVLTQHALGPKKSLAIIQVAGEAILIGVTDHNISMIKTIALIDDEFPEAAPRNFNSELDEYGEEEAPMRLGGSGGGGRGREILEDEDFTVQGLNEIRDKVSSRIKNRTV